jgi:hypothetical protein
MRKVSLQRHPHQMPPALGPSRSARRAPERDERLFGWERLVPLLVHPARVAVIEALDWMAQPLSPSELVNLFDDDANLYLSLVAYHVRGLAKFGVLEVVDRRPVSGSTEKFYFFGSK